MELNDNQKLLNEIYQNVGVALQSIENLLPESEETKIQDELNKEYDDYNVYLKEVEMLAKSVNHDLKGNNFFEKARLWTSIKMTTITDKSCQHLAQMMILGSTMGVVDLVRAATNLKKAENETIELAYKLERFERKNIESLFEYLKDAD